MMIPGYPDGVEIFEVLNDLRFVKISKKDRERVLHLQSEYRRRRLTVQEDSWARSLARRRLKQIEELKASYARVKETEAKKRLGTKKYEKLKAEATKKTRMTLLKKLQSAKREIEQAEEEQKDFGI